MYKAKILQLILLILLVMFSTGGWSDAAVWFQKPPDTDGIDTDGDGDPDNDHVFLHMTAGDGFTDMADGRLQYTFGFHDVTDLADPNDAIMAGMLAAEFPSPTIVVREGQKLYLTLTNVGMMIRPDLFDPHTIHWHGFPHASSIFDGVPSVSISINMLASLTYFYNVVEPGTYMWHCHVEATEHMQMGMLANLYVEPIQNMDAPPGVKYAYNDGDGSTTYTTDQSYPIQIASFDPNFHDASLFVQPLPFAAMTDKYPMFNGRGYPDTVNPAVLWNTAAQEGYADANSPSQPINSLITAEQGDRILLRISSLSTTSYHTVRVLGIPMQVVGTRTFNLTAKTGYIVTPDGGSYLMWGYSDDNGAGTMQYPGPTLEAYEGETVEVKLKNEVCVPVSMVFPGQMDVTVAGGLAGLMTRQAPPDGTTVVTYTFPAADPGTYMYNSGTMCELQIEMGLVLCPWNKVCGVFLPIGFI